MACEGTCIKPLIGFLGYLQNKGFFEGILLQCKVFLGHPLKRQLFKVLMDAIASGSDQLFVAIEGPDRYPSLWI